MVGAPINNRLRKIVGSTGGALITLLTFAMITLAIIYAFIPPIIQQARNFSSIDYNKVFQAVEEPLEDWNDWLVEKGILEEQEVAVASSLDTLDVSDKSIVEIVKIDSLINSQDSSRNNITIVVQISNPSVEPAEPGGQDILIADTFVERARKEFDVFS